MSNRIGIGNWSEYRATFHPLASTFLQFGVSPLRIAPHSPQPLTSSASSRKKRNYHPFVRLRDPTSSLHCHPLPPPPHLWDPASSLPRPFFSSQPTTWNSVKGTTRVGGGRSRIERRHAVPSAQPKSRAPPHSSLHPGVDRHCVAPFHPRHTWNPAVFVLPPLYWRHTRLLFAGKPYAPLRKLWNLDIILILIKFHKAEHHVLFCTIMRLHDIT
jgi:hypothetical protein